LGLGAPTAQQSSFSLGGMPATSGPSPLLGQQQQQQQVQITHLGTKDRRPVTYSTKIEDLDDASRALLQELEKKVKDHREHKRQLEAFDRLQTSNSNSKQLREELDMEVHVLSKKVQGLLSMLKADKQNLDSLYQVCMKLVRRTEAMSNASQRLKLRASTMQQMQSTSSYATTGSVMSSLPGDLGFRPPSTPSPFLVEALSNFELAFDQMSHVVGELEQLHLHKGQRGAGSEIRGLLHKVGVKEGEDMDQSMSKILDNFVVYFNHVLAQYSQVSEKLHKVKKDFNRRQKQQGVDRDYFAEADRKAVVAEERLRKEAEQKKQQASGAANPQQQAQPLQPQQPQQQPGALGFGTAAPAAATPNLFSTPQPTLGIGQSASLFSPSTFGAQPAAPAATMPGLFGAQPATPFGTTGGFGQNTFGGGASGGKTKSKSKRGK